MNPVEGDSRWVPRTWNWGQKAFNSWKDNYTIPFTLVEVGNYRLSVDFEREDYTGGAWKASGEVKTYTIPFKVTAAPVTQPHLMAMEPLILRGILRLNKVKIIRSHLHQIMAIKYPRCMLTDMK